MMNFTPGKMVLIWLTVALGLLWAMPNAFYERVEAHNDAVAAAKRVYRQPA